MDRLSVHYYHRQEEEGSEAQKTQTWPGIGNLGILGRDGAKIGSLLGIL